jgi:hypothetical protein
MSKAGFQVWKKRVLGSMSGEWSTRHEYWREKRAEANKLAAGFTCQLSVIDVEVVPSERPPSR